MTRSHRTLLGAAAALTYLAGCAGQEGALEQVGLTTACTEGGASCIDLGASAGLAVGTTLEVEMFSISAGLGLPSVRIESALPEVIAVDGATLSPLASGTVALLILTEDGAVLDFAHLSAVEPTELLLMRESDGRRPEGTVELLSGDELVVLGALGRDGQRLAGEATVVFTSSDSEVVSVLATGHPSERRLVARSPGLARVEASALGLSTAIELEVLP